MHLLGTRFGNIVENPLSTVSSFPLTTNLRLSVAKIIHSPGNGRQARRSDIVNKSLHTPSRRRALHAQLSQFLHVDLPRPKSLGLVQVLSLLHLQPRRHRLRRRQVVLPQYLLRVFQRWTRQCIQNVVVENTLLHSVKVRSHMERRCQHLHQHDLHQPNGCAHQNCHQGLKHLVQKLVVLLLDIVEYQAPIRD